MQKPLFVVISLFLMLGSSLQTFRIEFEDKIIGQYRYLKFTEVELNEANSLRDLEVTLGILSLVSFLPNIKECFPNFINNNGKSPKTFRNYFEVQKQLVVSFHYYMIPQTVIVSCEDGKDVISRKDYFDESEVKNRFFL